MHSHGFLGYGLGLGSKTFVNTTQPGIHQRLCSYFSDLNSTVNAEPWFLSYRLSFRSKTSAHMLNQVHTSVCALIFQT